MSNTCDGCKYAGWRRTAKGRLHPDKSGRCTFLEKHPLDLKIPAAFHWLIGTKPNPCGGYIERGREIGKCAFKSGESHHE